MKSFKNYRDNGLLRDVYIIDHDRNGQDLKIQDEGIHYEKVDSDKETREPIMDYDILFDNISSTLVGNVNAFCCGANFWIKKILKPQINKFNRKQTSLFIAPHYEQF